MISVVIPTLNAAGGLGRALESLVPAAAQGVVREVVVADGGSTDATLALAESAGCRIVDAAKGRGTQLRAGAEIARAGWLMFLHADTALEPGWEDEARAFMSGGEARAAAFRFALDDASGAARRLEFLVGARCAVFKLPYGDQGMVISRSLYDALGGYRPLPLFEDVDLVRRIGRGRLTLLKARAVTSAERFRSEGYLRRSARNLSLLTRYYLGASPDDLARAYERA